MVRDFCDNLYIVLLTPDVGSIPQVTHCFSGE